MVIFPLSSAKRTVLDRTRAIKKNLVAALTKKFLAKIYVVNKKSICYKKVIPEKFGDPERARTVDLQRDRLAF